MQKYDLDKIGYLLLRTAVGLTIVAEMLGVGVVFYLASFVRYVADDFCEIALLRNGPVWSVILEKYLGGTNRSANRFSKFFWVDVSQLLGKHDVQLLPIVLILLWLLGLIWIFHEVRKMLGLQHSFMVDVFMAASIVFFSILQAPNLFQIYFWRSSSLAHSAPVILSLLLVGFILSQIRSMKGKKTAFWVPPVVFLVSFAIGGAGETPTVLLVVVYLVLLLYFWRRAGVERRPGSILIGSAFAGTFLALCGLFFAPANFIHGKTSLLALPVAVLHALKYAFEFIWDTLLILPAPSAVSIALPGLLFFGMYIGKICQPLSPLQKRRVGCMLLLLPVLTCLLIAVSFAPSAYAQSYPIERVRFAGRFLLTAMLIFEGALLGAWFAGLGQSLSHHHVLFPVTSFLLLVIGFYPVRGGLWLLSNAETYRAWSSAWDTRNQYILQTVENGTTDLVVAPIVSIAGIGELKNNPKMWLNRCVADYYGLDSISSAP